MEKKSMKGYLFLMPALIIILLFTAYPLVRAFLMSFYEDYNMISGEYSRIGLGNYKDLFGDKDFIKALRNTSIYVVFVVPCSIASYCSTFEQQHQVPGLVPDNILPSVCNQRYRYRSCMELDI